MLSLSQALKATRRGAHVNNDAWRTLVLVRKPGQLKVVWDEVRALMDASSMAIESERYATRTMQVGKGSIIRFAAVKDAMDAYVLAGHTYTHIILLHDLPSNVEGYVRALLRSPTVPTDQLRFDRADW